MIFVSSPRKKEFIDLNARDFGGDHPRAIDFGEFRVVVSFLLQVSVQNDTELKATLS